MDKPSPNRIREWRERRSMTLEHLAEQSGISVSYLSRMEAGRRNVSLKNVQKLTGPLRVSQRDLVIDDESAERFIVKVVGRIGAGAEIHMDVEQVGPDGLDEIEIPFPVDARSLAFQVEGESMWPRYDPGDIVITGEEGTDIDQIVGWEAAVRTADGRRYLKRVRKGSRPGLFNLESHNASPIEDVALEWAAEIEHVVRAGKWRKLDRAAQKRLVARTMKNMKARPASGAS